MVVPSRLPTRAVSCGHNQPLVRRIRWCGRTLTRNITTDVTPIIPTDILLYTKCKPSLPIPQTIHIRHNDIAIQQRCWDLQRRHADVVLDIDLHKHRMHSCWEPIGKEGLVGYGKRYKIVGRDGALNCGSVDRYNEERCGRVSVRTVVYGKGRESPRGNVLALTHAVRRLGL